MNKRGHGGYSEWVTFRAGNIFAVAQSSDSISRKPLLDGGSNGQSHPPIFCLFIFIKGDDIEIDFCPLIFPFPHHLNRQNGTRPLCISQFENTNNRNIKQCNCWMLKSQCSAEWLSLICLKLHLQECE